MTDSGRKRILVVACVWLFILGTSGYIIKHVWFPAKSKKLLQDTGSDSSYRENVIFTADPFSGYCILRSKQFHNLTRRAGIKVTINKDEADYVQRAKDLRDRKIQGAVFTIDSFVMACTEINNFPASAVLVIDETKGADAIVSKGLKTIADLDNPITKIVLTPNSPSHFLANIIITEFNLPQLPHDWMISANGAADAYKRFKTDQSPSMAYILWQPYVSMAVSDGANVLLDSSKLNGLIVDILVFERSFLKNHYDTAKEIVADYLRAAYTYQKDGMTGLVAEDDISLTQSQSKDIVNGIAWKTTIDNYSHFGIGQQGNTHIEDMFVNITNILTQTKMLPTNNPVVGHESDLFYNKILTDLHESGFHPGKQTNILKTNVVDLGSVRKTEELPALTQNEWEHLIRVGDIRTEDISFARGSIKLNPKSERVLRDLADRLSTLPEFYLIIVGHTTGIGNRDANKQLAQNRAQAIADFLIQLGISSNRMLPNSDLSNAGSSATFIVGQRPY